jgi:hypothetical protein
MTALVAMAVHVYRSFRGVHESWTFNLLGPPVIKLAATRVADPYWASPPRAYWSEPVMGYLIS